jgi:homoserine O-succinyltransferase/O-acetyltransferase
MPASLNSNPSSYDRQQCTKGLCANPSAECLERSSKSLTIGLINNMADGALEATERQFLSLLNSASDGISVRLSLYSLPGVPRNELGARHVSKSYSSAENLSDLQLDGLIVTGREPLTPNLPDEPYWESFTRVLEWARDNTHSTVWSCLAAHAAILHMDGIGRIKSDHKHCGVFDCARLSDHPLIAGTPSRVKLPHSRWNGIPENELTEFGYRVLTRTPDAGVDTFIKQGKSMFVFFQGHPEYESNTLMLEYRRDVGRYLRGETDTYPLMPRNYFDGDTVIALTTLEQEARNRRREELLSEVSGMLEKTSLENTWRSTAVCIYRNWLQYICAQKKLRLQASKVAVEALRVDGLMSTLAAVRGVSTSAVFAADRQGPGTTSAPAHDALTIL